MKKFWTLLVAAVAFLAVSCDNDERTPDSSNELVGTVWSQDNEFYLEDYNAEIEVEVTIYFKKANVFTMTVTLEKDGIQIPSEDLFDGSSINGTWEYDKPYVYLTAGEGEDNETVTARIDGDKLYFETEGMEDILGDEPYLERE